MQGKLLQKISFRITIMIAAALAALGIMLFAGIVLAATNISSVTSEHWAWNDVVGWIDFYNTNNIVVRSQNLLGYASSSAGYISLDCLTAPGGPKCAAEGGADYQVTNDGSGDLSGWGWNDQYGWISFDCHNNGGCGTSAYEVVVNPSTGDFSGYAWNDTIGWISFNCSNGSSCGTSQYKVKTLWTAAAASGTLDSTTFDTGVSGGAQINSIMWQGFLPSGTAVDFQLAVSNSSGGPWNFKGPDGTANTYYGPIAPNQSQNVDYIFHNNFRYFRYRAILYTNQAQTKTPRVDDVYVNWSP